MEATAAEYGFTSYSLGQNAFGAGVTPPAGTYVTTAVGLYTADIGRGVSFGGVTLGAGAHIEFWSSAVNGLYVLEHKVLGGNLGISATVPVGRISIDAMVTAGLLRSTLPARSAAMMSRGNASTSTLRPTASAVAGETVAMTSCIRNTSVHNCSSPNVS